MDTAASQIMVIVPTGVRAEEELKKSLPRPEGVLFGHRVLAFDELISRLWQEIPQPGTLIGDTTTRLLLEHILSRHLDSHGTSPGLRRFRRADMPGLAETVAAFFAELKQALIWPERFEEILSRYPQGANPKTQELGELYRRFQKELDKRRLLDRYDREREIIRHMESGISLPFLEGIQEIRILDIYNPTLLRFSLLKTLARHTGNARITIPYDPERQDAYRFLEETVKLFEQLDEEETLYFDPRDIFDLPERNEDDLIGKVLSRIFKDPKELRNVKFPLDDSVKVIAAQGMYREIEEIGREITKLLDQGAAPEEIGVVFRNIGDYTRILEDVFRRYRLPLVLRRGDPLLANPLARTLLEIPEMILSGYQRERVLHLLGSGYSDFCSRHARDFSFREVEETVNAAGMLDEGSVSWQESLNRHLRRLEKKGAKDWKIARTRKIRDAILTELEKFRTLARAKSHEDFILTFRSLLTQLGIRKQALGATNPEILRRDAAALTVIEEMLTDILASIHLLGREKEPATLEDFFRTLRENASQRSLPPRPERRAGIRALNVYDAIGIRFSYLFLAGLAEGQFPTHKYENPLFTDEDKLAFNRAAKERIFRDLATRHQEEPLLFCLALGCARRRIYLSYSVTDSRGRPAIASTLLKGMLRLIDAPSTRDHDPGLYDKLYREVDFFSVPRLKEVAGREELYNRLATNLFQEPLPPGGKKEEWGPLTVALCRLLAAKPSGDEDRQKLRHLLRIARIEREREEFYLSPPSPEKEKAAGPWSGRIRTKTIREEIARRFLTGPEAYLSATSIEDFAQCPFRFYLARVLDLEEPTLPDLETEPMLLGTIVHAVLEKFFRRRSRKALAATDDPEKEFALLEKALKQVTKDYEGKEFLGDPTFWEMTKKRTADTVKRLVTREITEGRRDLSPSHFEHRFGYPDTPAAALQIPLAKAAKLKIRGKIDRIDLNQKEHAFCVIDYKNSARKEQLEALKEDKTMGKTAFQVPLYVMAAEQYLKRELKKNWREITERGGMLYLLQAPSSAKYYAEKKEFPPELLDTIRAALQEQMGRARDGKYGPAPFEQDCGFCPFGYICRYVAQRHGGAE